MTYYFETTISICYCDCLPNNIDFYEDDNESVHLGHQYISGRCDENARKKFIKFIERNPTCFEQLIWYLKCCSYKHKLYKVKNNTIHIIYK